MSSSSPSVDIVDIRGNSNPHLDRGQSAIRDAIVVGLSKPAGQKTLPTLILYDEHGLQLYDDITTKAPEYYLFAAEEEILKNHAEDIVRYMHAGTDDEHGNEEAVVELGAG